VNRASSVALVVATIVVLVSLAARVVLDAPASSHLLQRLIGTLLAAAALCGAWLTMARSPSIAWLATASAAGIAAEEIVAAARTAQPTLAADAWPVLVAVSASALVCGAGVAGGYAARRRGPHRPAVVHRAVGLMVGIGLAASAASGLVALAVAIGEAPAAPASPDLVPIRMAARISLAVMVLGVGIGLLRDLAGPVGRVRQRRAGARVEAAQSSWLADLADEMLPTRSIARRAGAEQERARLAAELHAFVLPDLRRAAAAADRVGVPEHVAESLRQSLDGVEQLMHERQSIVLEQFGLVAALEWLAERTEERGSLRVNLELDGHRLDDPKALPSDVARLAFRTALLALDNVVRHAAATVASVRLVVEREAVQLSITDDGRSFDASGRAHAGRGLADMRTEAARVGAAVAVLAPGTGTRVELRWPAPAPTEDPAIAGATIPARPRQPAG
jgi:signal transduction histidine kinase